MITGKNNEPVDPDEIKDVICLKRVYRTSQENGIERKITYVLKAGQEEIDNCRRVCLVEYKGGNLKEEEFGLSSEKPRGNASRNTNPVPRTDPNVFREMEDKEVFDRRYTNKEVFRMYRNTSEPSKGLGKVKQVANARFRWNRKKKKEKGLPDKKGNFSDEIQEIVRQLQSLPSVKECILKEHEYPYIFLYEDWMIKDMKKHVTKDAKRPSILCVGE